jgi:hypothetical protein
VLSLSVAVLTGISQLLVGHTSKDYSSMENVNEKQIKEQHWREHHCSLCFFFLKNAMWKKWRSKCIKVLPNYMVQHSLSSFYPGWQHSVKEMQDISI